MSRFNPDCIEVVDFSKVVFAENRSKIVFENPNRTSVCKVLVDGCQITEGLRCDFLLVEANNEHYIELYKV